MKRYLAYVASFFSKNWTLDSYPIRFRRNDDPQSRGSLRPYAWTAHIDGWPLMLGCGDSSAMAREDLARNLERYRIHTPLPRPGTNVPLAFAPMAKAQPFQTFGAAFVAERVRSARRSGR